MNTPNEVPDAEELVTPKEAARLLKDRNLKTIYRLIERGRLPAWRIVGRLYVRREDVLAFIEPVEPKTPLPTPENKPTSKQEKAALRRCEKERAARMEKVFGPAISPEEEAAIRARCEANNRAHRFRFP